MSLITRTAGAVLLSGLLASSALAAAGPLPAGKPAGVQQANLAGPGLLWIGIAAIVAVTVAVVASDDNGVTSTSTTGTP